MKGLRQAFIGALVIGALMTFGDWVWAQFITKHRTVFGMAHGLALCAGIGLFLGAPRGRIALGAGAGAAIGFGAAATFYLLSPLLRWGAMFPAWMAFWAAFGVLHWRFLGEPKAPLREAVVRGLVAAIGSGLAFYAISGIWTRPNPGGPDYSTNFASWTFAFLPGFLALLLEMRSASGR